MNTAPNMDTKRKSHLLQLDSHTQQPKSATVVGV